MIVIDRIVRVTIERVARAFRGIVGVAVFRLFLSMLCNDFSEDNRFMRKCM